MKVEITLLSAIFFLTGCFQSREASHPARWLKTPHNRRLLSQKPIFESQSGSVLMRQYKFQVGEDEVWQIEQVFPQTQSESVRRAEERWIKLDSIYDPSPSPYFAVITQEVACPDRFRPKKTLVDRGFKIQHFANQRFAYRVCRQQEAIYKVTSQYLHCGDNFFWVTVTAKNKMEKAFEVDCQIN